MSQVKFNTVIRGRKVEVVGGWDVPLSSYHLTIFRIPDNDDPVYCQLDNEVPFPRENDSLKKDLDKMGIKAPDGFWERCERKEGNMTHSFVEGQWVEYA